MKQQTFVGHQLFALCPLLAEGGVQMRSVLVWFELYVYTYIHTYLHIMFVTL